MYSGFRKYFYNTSWQLFSQLLRLISSLFIGTLVARYLGPVELGRLNFSVAFVSIVSAVAPLGLDTILLKEILNDRLKTHVYLGSAFILKMIAASLIIVIVFISLQWTSFDKDINLMIMLLLGMSLFQSFNVIAVYFQSEVDGRALGLASIMSVFLSSLVKIVLLVYHQSVVYFSLVYLLDSITLSSCYLLFYRNKNQKIHYWKFDRGIAKKLLKDSFPLLLSGIVVLVYMRIDQVMLKFMVGDSAVGNYSVAVSLAEVWFFVPTVISTAIFPAVVNAKKISADLYMMRVQRMLTLMLWISIVFAFPISFFSGWIVDVLYGPKYSYAADLLPLMAFTGVFVSLGVSSGKWYIVENLQFLFFKRALYGMIVNIGLNLLLIPSYGGKGAAVATFISYFMSSFLFDLFSAQTRPLFFMKLKSPYGGFSKKDIIGLIYKEQIEN